MILSRHTWVGTVLIILGVLMLLDRIGAVDFNEVFRTYWPLLLVFVGSWMLFRRSERGAAVRVDPIGIAGDVHSTSTADRVKESNVFGNVNINIRSNGFTGGKVSTVFGNSTVDLTGSALATGDQALAVDTVFGKVRVLVPAEFPVKVSADTVLGSVTVNGQKRDGMLPAAEWTSDGYTIALSRLRIHASAVLGEVIVTPVVR
jgi:predicted membrane protein